MHEFEWIVGTHLVMCHHCDLNLRLATGDESRFLRMTDTLDRAGAFVLRTNMIAVPLDFAL